MPHRRPGLMIVLDGLGDLPSETFAGRTPLEAAETPCLDALAAGGLCGMVDPLSPGMPVDTHTGTALLMGLAPADALTLSRGPVEAAGVGTPLRAGDVAVRANFATVETDQGRLRVVDRRAGRIRRHTHDLAATLANVDLGEGVVGTLVAGTQHRAVVRLRGEGLSGDVSDTDPGSLNNPGWVLTAAASEVGDRRAVRTAAALNRFVHRAHELLRHHPVNQERQVRGEMPATGIVTRGAGMLHQCRNLLRHVGVEAALVSGERTVLGLGNLFGFTTVTAPGFTALPNTDLEGKIAAVQAAFLDHDLVFLHIKATDVCSHDRQPLEKRDFLQRFDAALAGLENLDGLVVAVSGDHSTDSTTGVHSGDPVPSLLRVPGGRKDAVAEYGEFACLGGGLGRIRASSLLMCLLNGMARLPNYRPLDREFL